MMIVWINKIKDPEIIAVIKPPKKLSILPFEAENIISADNPGTSPSESIKRKRIIAFPVKFELSEKTCVISPKTIEAKMRAKIVKTCSRKGEL